MLFDDLIYSDERGFPGLGARESMENRYEGSPEESLIGNCAEFENDGRLNRDPVGQNGDMFS